MLRRRTLQLLPAVAVAALSLAAVGWTHAPAFGPPWISIEYPPSPYDRVTRNALLLVHSYHHATPVGLPVSGTGEGIVSGQRRTVKLEFENTARPGVFALRKQWPTEGAWVLNITVSQGDHEYDKAGALVTIGADGQVASVKVPLERRAGVEVATPRRITQQEVDAALQTRLASR